MLRSQYLNLREIWLELELAQVCLLERSFWLALWPQSLGETESTFNSMTWESFTEKVALESDLAR